MDISKKQNIFDEIIKIPNYLKTPFCFFITLLIIFIFFFPYKKSVVIYTRNDNDNDIYTLYIKDIEFLYNHTLYINNEKKQYYIENIEKDPVTNTNIVRIKIDKIKNKIVKLTFKSKKTTLIKEIKTLLEKGIN